MSHANGSQGLPFCYLNALQAPCERLPSNSRWFFLLHLNLIVADRIHEHTGELMPLCSVPGYIVRTTFIWKSWYCPAA